VKGAFLRNRKLVLDLIFGLEMLNRSLEGEFTV
jgi:hypothetical protein